MSAPDTIGFIPETISNRGVRVMSSAEINNDARMNAPVGMLLQSASEIGLLHVSLEVIRTDLSEDVAGRN